MNIKKLDEFKSNLKNQKPISQFEMDMVETIESFGFHEKHQEIMDRVNAWWKDNEKNYDKENDDPDDLCITICNEVIPEMNDNSEEFEDMCYHIAEVLLEQN